MDMSLPDLKPHFSRFLGAAPGRLHFAAHSHHPWPDVSFDAHLQAWLDAARFADDKWTRAVFGEVVPEAARHIAGRLGLSDPAALAFGPNTHGLVVRLISALPSGTVRILTTDAEFHSFTRQARRLEEEGLATIETVRVDPYGTFPERMRSAAAGGGHDLVYFSQVHFNSAYVHQHVAAVVEAVPDPETVVVIDGYHGFMALPTDLGSVEARAFYTAGGYKYAMAGEGACFMHCPPGYALRPLDTGWFAEFSDLAAAAQPGQVPFAPDGSRFAGGTFDSTPLYRLNAVQRWLDDIGVSVADIHTHVARLQQLVIDQLDDRGRAALVPGLDEVADRGHFLVLRLPDAGLVRQRLADAGVMVDHRDDRLRIGFGLYHDESDVDELIQRLKSAQD
ncbi:MAG: aminotransferase class V-fold PLP-dependent enzyme [Acidimicrobiia bacterium]